MNLTKRIKNESTKAKTERKHKKRQIAASLDSWPREKSIRFALGDQRLNLLRWNDVPRTSRIFFFVPKL